MLPEAAATAPEQNRSFVYSCSSSEVKNLMHLAAPGAEPARRFVWLRTDPRETGLPCLKEKKGKQRKAKENKSLSG